MPYHVSKKEFNDLVEKALAELPPPFDRYMEEIPLEICDYPTSEQKRSLNLEKGHLLLGLYVGRPRTKRHVEDEMVLPDRIYIFQQSIEQVCENEEELVKQVRTTVLHEIGHHFGMSEQDLSDLGYG
ncbi:MAG TPA: metallopeptidase family protein [Tepidisphaeraceae bacterium]|nr:metallopeptidase family protein [Tepidisphaeraceae bacterium]